MAATYTLPPLSDVMARALGSGAGGPPDAAAQIRSVLTGPPQDMTSPEARPWIEAMNPKPEFDHRAAAASDPPDADASQTGNEKDTVPLQRRSLDQLNISAARLRSARGMIGFHEADLAKAKDTFAASQTRLRNGVRGPEAGDALWNYNYNKADVASRQGELDWANHELREAQAKHDDHQAWHDSMFKKPEPASAQDTAPSADALSVLAKTDESPVDGAQIATSGPSSTRPEGTVPTGFASGDDSSTAGSPPSAAFTPPSSPAASTATGVQTSTAEPNNQESRDQVAGAGATPSADSTVPADQGGSPSVVVVPSATGD